MAAMSAAAATPIAETGLLGGVVETVAPVTAGVGRLLNNLLGFHEHGHHPGAIGHGHEFEEHHGHGHEFEEHRGHGNEHGREHGHEHGLDVHEGVGRHEHGGIGGHPGAEHGPVRDVHTGFIDNGPGHGAH
ncbi:hypothetical protein LPJ62_006789, partial [Coemansia sp. RSA 2167]